MDEEILEPPIEEEETVSQPWYNNYEIYDENNELIVDPDLELGYLNFEKRIVYHDMIPEQGHYYVSYLELSTGDSFFLQEGDERIEFIDPTVGTFKYLPAEEDPTIKIKSASVRYIVDQQKVDAWEESYDVLRYILYTEEELANKEFLKEAPERLEILESDTNDLFEVVADLAGSDIEDRVTETQEAITNIEEQVAENQETVEDLLLVVADLLGGVEE